MNVFVLLHTVEYESSTVLGVFSSFDLALNEARQEGQRMGMPELQNYGRYDDPPCYEPYKDNSSFFQIQKHEVRGDK